ncbi:hypothetical protein RYX36_026252 [Vicia faba]
MGTASGNLNTQIIGFDSSVLEYVWSNELFEGTDVSEKEDLEESIEEFSFHEETFGSGTRNSVVKEDADGIGNQGQDKGRPLPKFGEWDVNNPASAEGFTVIFNKARDEKKTNTAVHVATPRKPDPVFQNDDFPRKCSD